jgi:hypothetical protein
VSAPDATPADRAARRSWWQRSAWSGAARLRRSPRIPKVVLVALQVRPDIAGRHQSGIVAGRLEPPARAVGADTGLHADQAGRQVGEPGLELPARQLPAQDDGAALIEADEVEGVLADVDAEDGDGVGGPARHGGAPYCHHPHSTRGTAGSTAGRSH